MQFNALFFTTLSLASAAMQKSTEHAMSGVEGSLTNARQVQDTLNRQLQSENGAHANQARINAFITGADSQIDNAVATVSDALAPFTGGVSKAIGNFLLGPFVQAVTNGAEVFLSNVIGRGEDEIDAELTARLTGNYAKLAEFASKNNVDVSRLQDLNQQITRTIGGSKGKRAMQEATVQGMSGFQGAMTNARQVQDTLNRQLQSENGAHANQARINAFITGADSQIDNAIATVGNALSGVTGGASKAVADFLLGPFVQAVTNGAEVFLSNVIGRGEDEIDAELTARLTGNYAKLAEFASKNNVDVSRLQNLNQQITRTIGGSKGKRSEY